MLSLAASPSRMPEVGPALGAPSLLREGLGALLFGVLSSRFCFRIAAGLFREPGLAVGGLSFDLWPRPFHSGAVTLSPMTASKLPIIGQSFACDWSWEPWFRSHGGQGSAYWCSINP
jgi:hypothetical protein